MGKRFAGADLTQDDIEALKKGEEVQSKPNEYVSEDNDEQIAERKIVKVKRHQPSGKNEEVAAKGTFKLSGSLNSSTEAKPATTSLFGQAPTQGTSLFGGPKPTTTSSTGLFGQKPATTSSGGLFGNNNTSNTPSLFGGNSSAPAKKEEDNSVTLFGKKIEKPAQTMFGGQPVKQSSEQTKSTSLFGQPASKPVETKTLFGGPVSKENSVFSKNANIGETSLFAQNEKKKEEESKPAPATGGLFGKPAGASTSLFGQPAAGNTSGGLFGQSSTPATSGGLFGKPQNSLFGGNSGGSSLFGQPAAGGSSFNFSSGSTLFGNTSNNQKKEDNDDKDENDDTGNPKNEAPSFKAQPQQESPFEKVFNQYVAKFKILTPKEIKSSLGCGTLTLEKDKKDSTRCFICFRNTIGKLLYQGQIIKGVSKKRRVTEKANKQQLKVALMRKDPESKPDTPKLQNNFIAINFDKLEQLEQFEKDFDQSMNDIVEGNKQSPSN